MKAILFALACLIAVISLGLVIQSEAFAAGGGHAGHASHASKATNDHDADD